MSVPRLEIEGCRRAHAAVAMVVAQLTEESVRQPSLLPGWSVGHVLTHIARNADAMVRRIDGALHSQLVEQYEGGAAGRAAEIEGGAFRPAEQIAIDVSTACDRLDAAFSSVPDDAWSAQVTTVGGTSHAMERLPFRRWREVEVHLIDLGMGPASSGWPQELVDLALPRLIASLADRCDQRMLMAWALGRGPAPDLDAWG